MPKQHRHLKKVLGQPFVSMLSRGNTTKRPRTTLRNGLLIDEVNKATRSKGLVKKVPLIQLDENLVWYGALAYCSLDTKQTLVEATMKLITNEWEKSEKR